MPMPEKTPEFWVLALAWVSQHSTPIYAGLVSAVMAVLRIIYGGGTRRQALFEGIICTLFTIGLIPVLEYFGLPQNLATAAGVFTGFMGVKKLAALADRVTDFKLPKRNADQ